MTLQQTLKKFGETMAGLPVSVFHYKRPRTPWDRYVVWQEDSEGETFHADNRKAEHRITGTLDYFTKVEYDQVADKIQQLLEANCCTWRLGSVQYEEATELIHFEWEWELSYGEL